MENYTVKEAAQYLDMNVPAFRQHMRKGNISGVKRAGVYFFNQEELDYFNANRRPPHRPAVHRKRLNKAISQVGIEAEIVVEYGRTHVEQDVGKDKPHIIKLDDPPSRMSLARMVDNIKRLAK